MEEKKDVVINGKVYSVYYTDESDYNRGSKSRCSDCGGVIENFVKPEIAITEVYDGETMTAAELRPDEKEQAKKDIEAALAEVRSKCAGCVSSL